jgi:phage gp36-like protein
MSYITNEDIELRLGHAAYVHLTDDNGDGNADAGVVDEARLAAEGEVNSFLARRFAVPIDVAAVPELADVLKSVTLDLVECRLRARRPPVSEDARRKADQARGWLQSVAEARIDLPAAGPLPPSPLRGSLGEVTGESRILTFDELSDH